MRALQCVCGSQNTEVPVLLSVSPPPGGPQGLNLGVQGSLLAESAHWPLTEHLDNTSETRLSEGWRCRGVGLVGVPGRRAGRCCVAEPHTGGSELLKPCQDLDLTLTSAS